MPANNKKQVEKKELTAEEKKQNAQKLVDDLMTKSQAALKSYVTIHKNKLTRFVRQWLSLPKNTTWT